jgi:hypothetical protein
MPAGVLAALERMQAGRELRFGAWIGGRSTPDAPCRLKLYVEVPPGTRLDDLPLPAAVRALVGAIPGGAVGRLIGHEPVRDRTELYLRMPGIEVGALGPVLAGAGQGSGLGALDRALPDGRERLRGRRLGLSLAATSTSAAEVALFASARTLFPGSPELVDGLVPVLASVPSSFRRTLVSLTFDPEGRVHPAVGLTAAAGVAANVSA